MIDSKVSYFMNIYKIKIAVTCLCQCANYSIWHFN